MNDNTKEKYLTQGWNNILSLVGGLILIGYVVFVMSTSVLSDIAAFIGLVIIGVVY
jgi:hypothetical protein